VFMEAPDAASRPYQIMGSLLQDGDAAGNGGRGLHSSTFRLIARAFFRMGGAHRVHKGGVQGVFRGC